MAGTNSQIVEKAFRGYSEHIDKVIYDRLDKWCEEILRKAIFDRLMPEGSEGHNFTGNLINSICVVLYRKSKSQKTTYFADRTGLKPAIRRELSALNSRGRKRSYRLRFAPGSKLGDRDWSGRMSFLKPENLIPTDESYGIQDAHQFASLWYPTMSSDFVICVAYTSEYANFVEQQRHTTGFLETMDFVDRTAIEWVGLN